MKKLILVVTMLLTLSNIAMAVMPIGPGPHFRPALGAWNMEIVNPSERFKSYTKGQVTVFERTDTGELTSISVILLNPDLDNMFQEKLDISHVEKTFCGDTYTANYIDSYDQRRVHIELVDMSNATCEIYVEHLWTVTITEGYGFCGTMDDSIIVVGDPEPVAYIM